ncbi:MAG: type II toxin-antitoxin system YhaV family toxin [Terriglobia bacterium]
MEAHGWTLYLHPLFQQQLEKLTAQVETLQTKAPLHYKEHSATKLLATINRYIREIIPCDPGAAEFRQGNTLGADNRHWFRAKFHGRYRLFFRYSSQEKVIVYAWVNDEKTLRKGGSRTDPYSVFRAMLNTGNPPSIMAELLAVSSRLEAVRNSRQQAPVKPSKKRNG